MKYQWNKVELNMVDWELYKSGSWDFKVVDLCTGNSIIISYPDDEEFLFLAHEINRQIIHKENKDDIKFYGKKNRGRWK